MSNSHIDRALFDTFMHFLVQGMQSELVENIWGQMLILDFNQKFEFVECSAYYRPSIKTRSELRSHLWTQELS